MQNKKCKKEDILTFLNVLGYYFTSHEKNGHVLQKEDVWQPYWTMLLICDLCKSQTQKLPVTS